MLAATPMTPLSEAKRTARLAEWFTAGILTVFIIYAHVRVWQHAGPLWRDEISSLRVATMPTLAGFWSSLVYDPFPAIFFGLLRVWHWLGWGSSDQGLRVLGLVIGLAILGAIWMAAWMIRRSPPSWALVLFGLSPVALVWGDSLRAYGLSCVCNVLAIGLIWRLLGEAPNTRKILLTTLVAILSVHSAFPNAFFLFAAGGSAIVVSIRRQQWRTVRVIVGIGAFTAFSLLIYTPIIRESQTWTGLAKGAINTAWIFKMILNVIQGGGNIAVALWIGGAFVAFLAFWVGLIKPRRVPLTEKEKDLFLYAGMTFLVALILIVSFFRVVGWKTSIWYYVPLMATAAICIDTIAGALRKNSAAVIVSSALLLITAIPLGRIAVTATSTRLTNVDLVAEEIGRYAERSDLIVVDNYFYAISFNRYYHGRAPWIFAPGLEDLSLHRWDLLINSMRKSRPIQPLLEQIDQTLKAGHHVFVVGYAPTTRLPSSPPDLPPAPKSSSGWSLWPYMSTWTGQIAYDAQLRASKGMIISVPCRQNVNIAECINAFVVSGWRDETGG